ncbi:tRNA (adenine(58)-N(1))-methyltransferase non-catalytic subunit TRM6-like isoform X2 [Dysidea avara]|uniref:tRNA (adenine(58)-N(1))-methyltransferase non-catalytic subunit TRM6-like isoform X2 n=1 Tax=Dysidea avara TaxID=196820 RepID=UPI0033205A32
MAACHTVVQEGDAILLRCDKAYKPAVVTKGRHINISKQRVSLCDLIGYNYGTSLKLHNNKLSPMDSPSIKTNDSTAAGRDNRHISDDRSSQLLSQSDIITMKGKGVDGEEIVESVVKNSTSFSERNEFSQEKYVKRKQRKHVTIVTVVRPSTRLLCHMYYNKGPSRICQLRIDSISQLITMANVRAGSRIIAMETCQGLLLGTILERMGGNGLLLQLFTGDLPVRKALDYYGSVLSEKDRSILEEYPLRRINQVSLMGECNQSECVVDNDDITRGMSSSSSDEEPSAKRTKTTRRVLSEDKEAIRLQRQAEREQRYSLALGHLREGGFDGLVIATPHHPMPITMATVTLLAPSRPFAIYHQFVEPLVTTYQSLKESGLVFNLQLSDTMLRYYQVMSARTHPIVQMSGTSGYLLTGTTIVKS